MMRLPLFVLIIVLMVGCTSSDDGDGERDTVIRNNEQYGNTSIFVTVENDLVSTDPISTLRGGTIVWRNADPYTHELKSSEFGTLRIPSQGEAAHTFTTTGVYVYTIKKLPSKQHKVVVN